MPPAVAAAGISTAGGLIGGALNSGGQTTTQGLTLPPELEFQLLDFAQQDFEQVSQDLERINAAEQLFGERIDVLEGTLNKYYSR